MAAVLGCLAKWRSPGRFLWLIVALCLFSRPLSAATLTLMVNTTEPVTAGGAPRIGMDVGGTMIQGLSADAQRAKATAKGLRRFVWIIAFIQLWSTAALGATLTFTVTASEPVTITGTPRIAVNVGGVIRYANYAGTQGQAIQALPFTYLIQAGDFDPDGISIDDPQIDLNGATISDAAGNPLSSLAFTKPNTSSLRIQTYTAAFETSPITNTNASAVSFVIAKAPVGGSFTYTITSSGGSGSVTGAGTIASMPQTVSGVDVSNLPSGTLTVSVTVSKGGAGTGTAQTATATPGYAALTPLSSAAIALSTRRMFSSYAGALLRVRRSTDDTEQDIGATVGGGLNTTALTAFCGSASCFISTWYDQSGNGRNASQAASGRQPRLVNAGSIETLNGLPAAWFNGTGMGLNTASAVPTGNAGWSTHLIDALGDGGTGRGRIWGVLGGSNLGAKLSGDDYFGPGVIIETSFYTTPRIGSLVVDTTSATVYGNGGHLRTTTVANSWLGGVLGIGNMPDYSRAFAGRAHTIYLGVGGYSTAERQAIERWLGNISGITVP
ncbi:arabinofuranosidase catalytic domain-containing protein [Aestuariivirga sp.]|uniref:arabinofuranosidase catalytic domain-containing protein n=1 Tax=Aestuariivirga sp. TaxID=2650926 RepID=UPI003BAA026F